MIINANTKIGHILKENANALEAIISLSIRFEKLRNPFLRKIMAGRTSLHMASMIGGCSVNDFYKKLEPLGFKIDLQPVNETVKKTEIPAFVKNLSSENITELDVRNTIASGQDPLTKILDKVNALKPGTVLKLINTFEPVPLIILLKKKGFETYVDQINHNRVDTYFYKAGNHTIESRLANYDDAEWNNFLKRFENAIQFLDVRNRSMPQPMISILEALENLPDKHALFVYHSRVPLFLIPELADKGFLYRIKKVSETEVHMLIFKL